MTSLERPSCEGGGHTPSAGETQPSSHEGRIQTMAFELIGAARIPLMVGSRLGSFGEGTLKEAQQAIARQACSFLGEIVRLNLGGEVLDRMALAAIHNMAEIVCETYRQIEELKRQALEDSLTGLPNRRAFEEELPRMIARSRRKRDPLCLMMVDLDGFKAINDGYGHGAGDQMLKVFASLLRGAIRTGDFAARWGGDEMGVLLPGATLEAALAVAHRVHRALKANPVALAVAGKKEVRVGLGASIGIAALRAEDNEKGIEIRDRADHCLYILKGKRPDGQLKTEERRGQVAAEGFVYSPEGMKGLAFLVPPESEQGLAETG